MTLPELRQKLQHLESQKINLYIDFYFKKFSMNFRKYSILYESFLYLFRHLTKNFFLNYRIRNPVYLFIKYSECRKINVKK